MRDDAREIGDVFHGASISSERWEPDDGTLLRGAYAPHSLWVVTVTLRPGAPQEWGMLRTWLDGGECAKTERFRREEDRWSYAASHALRRLMLGKFLGVAPRTIEYRTNANGRPELKRRPNGAPPVQFSASHTVRGVTCALSPSGDIGADIEWMDPRLTVADFDALLSPVELAESRQGQETILPQRLFQCWTLKEAYLKAAGVGLAVHPHSFSMGISPPRVIAPPPLLHGSSGWALGSWLPSPEHVASVAARGCALQVSRGVLERPVT